MQQGFHVLKCNPKHFLITFIPNAQLSKFASADTTNTIHKISATTGGVKFIYNPKSPVGLSQGILDFTKAKPVESDEDVSMNVNFYYMTDK